MTLELSNASGKIRWRDLVAIACITLLASVVEISRTMANFDIFDASGFLDVFYRVASGQKLYTDFFYNAGPVHPYIGAFLFLVFGAGKYAVMANAVLLCAFIVVLSYSLAREQFGVIASAALSSLAALYFVGPMARPNYDHHAWAFALTAIFLLRVKFSDKPRLNASLRGLCSGALLGLSVLAKTNIGAMSGVVAAGVLLMLAEPARALFWLSLGFFIVVNLIFIALGTPFDFINNCFFQYTPLNRLSDWSKLTDVLHTSPFVPFVFMTAALAGLGGKSYLRSNLRDFSILLGLSLIAIFSTYTGSMIPDLNAFSLGLEFVLLFTLIARLPRGPKGSVAHRLYGNGLLVASVFGLLTFATGIEKTWHLYFWQSRLSDFSRNDYQIRALPLRGWSCQRQSCEPMDEAVDYLNAHVEKSDSLFVFPDLTVVYLLTGHESYRHAPFQFVLNLLPSPGKDAIQFLNHFDQNRPKWILLHDAVYGPVNVPINTGLQLKSLLLDQYFNNNYSKVWSSKNISILKLR